MFEIFFLLSLFVFLLLFFWLKRRPAKWWVGIFIAFYATGSLMNLVAIRANGGQMPVMGDVDFKDAPNIKIPISITEPFLDTLSETQKVVASRTDVHRIYTAEESSSIRFAFLADRYPLKISGKLRLIYSLGDVFIFLGYLFFIVAAIPVWLLCRRINKRELS